jgi:hypothetical protein
VTKRRRVYDGSVYDPITRDEADAAFQSGDPHDISYALLRLALTGTDGEYAERCALEHIQHPDVWVRRNAATSLAHIARIFGRLDLDRTVPSLLSLMADPEVYGEADDALDTVEHYLGVNRGEWLPDPQIRSIGYEHHDQVVEVELADGGLFQYTGVDPFDYRDMWTTPDPARPGLLSRLSPYPRRRLRKPRITRRSTLKAG